MLSWLTVAVLVVAVLYGVIALVHVLRDTVVDDRLLLAAAALEVLLVAQVVVGIVQGLNTTRDFEAPVFYAYLGTLPLVPPFVTLLALKDKTRWAMGVVAGSAVVIAVFLARLTQMWTLHG
ncbi:hypothetical protein V3N99_17815 [Dermatophilaceae bacterium Soc4.6]